MGVDLTPVISGREIKIDDLSGKKIAIDAFNTLYQFLSIIRQRDGTPLMDSHGRVTSHLAGLFYRTSNLLAAGIKPCFVFDGKPPTFKAVSEDRRQRREQARKKYEDARTRGDEAEAFKYAQQSSKLTDEIVDEAKTLIAAMGLPWVQAPGEGEAQAAFMCRNGDVYATGSQDYDALIFGSTNLVRNLNITGRRKLPGRNAYKDVSPEIYNLDEVLSSLGVTHDQLIQMAVLTGTDYNPGGVKGIGPKTALKLVKENSNPFSQVEWKFKTRPDEIARWFKSPDVGNYELKWKDIDIESVKSILCDEHGFSSERVENTLSKLGRAAKTSQKSLGDF